MYSLAASRTPLRVATPTWVTIGYFVAALEMLLSISTFENSGGQAPYAEMTLFACERQQPLYRSIGYVALCDSMWWHSSAYCL